jgi:hypothetical protein
MSVVWGETCLFAVDVYLQVRSATSLSGMDSDAPR